MPQSLCVLLNTECPSGTHTDTHIETHTHTLLHRQGLLWVITPAPWEGRMICFCLSVCFAICDFLLFIVYHQFCPHSLSVGGLQKPLKQCGCQYSNTETNTMKAHFGRPREIERERMGYCDYCTVGKQSCLTFQECSIFVVLHTTSVLFVVCLLIKYESETDWNAEFRLEGSFYFWRTWLDPSC